MEESVQLNILACLISGVICPTIMLVIGTWINRKNEEYKRRQDAILQQQMEELAKKQQREAERDMKFEQMQDGIRAVLRDRILQSCNFFIAQGKITPLALENITMMHDSYKLLGGNGLCDKQFESVNDLPVTIFYQKGVRKQ